MLHNYMFTARRKCIDDFAFHACSQVQIFKSVPVENLIFFDRK